MQEAPDTADSPYEDLPETPAESKNASWALIAIIALLPFVGYWAYGLLDLDEGFYGSVVAEMNRRGEWITPYYNGHPWFEKPILLYWLAKPCLMLFGGVLGLRLPSVLASLGLFATAGWFVRKHVSEAAAQIVVLVLAGSLLVVGAGRMMLVDPLMNLCLAGALLTFWDSLQASPRMRVLSGFLLGCSALAKGPVGIILFVGIAGWTFWKQPSLRPGFKGGWIGFTVALVAAIALWYLPAYLQNGRLFVDEFLIRQNLQRFTGGDEAHSAGPVGLLLYPLVLLLGLAPWNWFALRTWPKRDGDPLERFLASWAFIAFLFFSISGTKLVHYILPAAAPIAILAAIRLASGRKSLTAKGLLPFAAVAASVASLTQIGFTAIYASDNAELHRIARYVRVNGGPAAAYQMPRREKDLGTLQPKLKETSHPSLPFYVSADVLEAEKLGQLIDAPKPLWVITRTGRIRDEDIEECAAIGYKMRLVPVEGAERNYLLYRLEDHRAQAPSK